MYRKQERSKWHHKPNSTGIRNRSHRHPRRAARTPVAGGCAVRTEVRCRPWSLHSSPLWCSQRSACWRPACSACGWRRRGFRRSCGGWMPSRGGDRCRRRRFPAWPTSCSRILWTDSILSASLLFLRFSASPFFSLICGLTRLSAQPFSPLTQQNNRGRHHHHLFSALSTLSYRYSSRDLDRVCR